ncbi:MAG: adenosylcobinamide-GDP ribazoletransferase [Hyphomicrobiales bacterium]|nr:MAG: adenosylcobinamide-GDP ribazoletransferase [Hyphomicrobiales bacterium]
MNSENDTPDPALLQRVVAMPVDFLRCLVFFTRIPVRWDLGSNIRMESTSQAFPLVGLLVGGISAFVLAAAHVVGLPALPSAILAVATQILLTGAMHEDGLADTADGFGGGHSKERKLEIMKDSSLGTYGMLALLLTQMLRISVVSGLLSIGVLYGVVGIISAAMFSRAASMNIWHTLPHARDDGLSQSVGRPDRKALSIAWASTIIVLFLYPVWLFDIGATLINLFVCIGLNLAFQILCRRQIGGQTGDTIGASQQLVELVFLCGLLISVSS